MSIKKTAIYLACFHSEKPESFDGATGQYLKVERAISEGEWPYDNGDDPSFYVARQGGRLTWGVCRQDVRNAIKKDNIVVFFSFTRSEEGIVYRLCAVATVDYKIDHRSVCSDPGLQQFQHLYINRLITRDEGGWKHAEEDRHRSERHEDWLWRIADRREFKADRRRINKDAFDRTYRDIYRNDRFSDDNAPRLGDNYVIFSPLCDRTFISPNPPVVANAVRGKSEEWTDQKLREMTVGKAATLHPNRRAYLRLAKRSGWNVHRHLRFEMPADDAREWRDALIATLKESTANSTTNRACASGTHLTA